MINRDFIRMMAIYNQWIHDRLYPCCALLTDSELKLDRGVCFRSIYGTLDHLLQTDLSFLAAFTARSEPVSTEGRFCYPVFAQMLAAPTTLDAHLLSWSEIVVADWLGAQTTSLSRVDGLSRTAQPGPSWFTCSTTRPITAGSSRRC